MRLNLYSKEEVIRNFPYSSNFLMLKTPFNEFFTNFLRESFGWNDILRLLPMIQYCATFVILPLKFDLPTAIPEGTLDNEEESINYENFCSYQTKNENTLPSLNKRNRSIIWRTTKEYDEESLSYLMTNLIFLISFQHSELNRSPISIHFHFIIDNIHALCFSSHTISNISQSIWNELKLIQLIY